MKLIISKNKLTVYKEKGDPRFRHSEWGSAESQLLYHIKKKLNLQGFDLIKKRMHKDGHLVDENQLYLRSRKETDGFSVAIFNGNYALGDAGEKLMKNGKVELTALIHYEP